MTPETGDRDGWDRPTGRERGGWNNGEAEDRQDEEQYGSTILRVLHLVSMRRKMGLLGGCLAFSALSVSPTQPAESPPPWILLVLVALFTLLLSSTPLRRSLGEAGRAFVGRRESGWGEEDSLDGRDERMDRRVGPVALAFLMFGFMGLANTALAASHISTGYLRGWLGVLPLGLCQLWIGLSESWRRTPRASVDRRAAILCLCSALWSVALYAWNLFGEGGLVWFYKEGFLPSIDWERAFQLLVGFGRWPFFSGLAGWLLVVGILIKISVWRRAEPRVDLVEFLGACRRLIGVYLSVVGCVIIAWLFIVGPGVLADQARTPLGPVVLVVLVGLGSGALLSSLVGVGLVGGLYDDYMRKRAALLAAYLGCLSVFFMALSMTQQQWFPLVDWAFSYRARLLSGVLEAVVAVGLIASLTYSLASRGARMKARTLSFVALTTAIGFALGWIIMALI